MTIRCAVSSDIPILLELLEMLFALEADFPFEGEKSRRGLELMLQNPDSRMILVAQCDGEIAGMCSAQLMVSTAMGTLSAWVEDVVLKPQFRGRGLMPQLLAELERWAQGRGATRFQLLCDIGNEPALSFYPQVGYGRTQLVCFHKFPDSQALAL